LNASRTQKICEVLAFYARWHSSGKPITKSFPTPARGKMQERNRRNSSVLLGVTPQTGGSGQGVVGD